MYPDTPHSYLELIQAVDREAFAAHLDIVNVLASPALAYRSTSVIHEWFDLLGPMIRSIHAKDIILRDHLTVHLDECRPGTGLVDYKTYLSRAAQLDDRVCVMLEHMTEEEDYILATAFIKKTAASLGITL
jgi:sugar phosphate isomerase/epimerase